MDSGMLWFDNNPKTTLTTKIEKAVDYYRHKYGRDPNLCLVHPSMMESITSASGAGENPQNGKIMIRPYRPVLPGHLWIGIEEKS